MNWSTGPFLKLNFTAIEKRLNMDFLKQVIQLNKLMSDLDDPIAENVIVELKKDIETFREKLWVIDLLTTEAMIKKPIYWKEIAKECEIDKL